MVFLFRKHKSISHKQASLIGFVLALMSVLSTLLVSVLGFYSFRMVSFSFSPGMSVFILLFWLTVFFSVQGLLLFGFPLFYAQDKKSHMTGFQILLYALLWMFALLAIFFGMMLIVS